MKVVCDNGVQFMNAVESSVKKGLLFTACFGTLTIEYNGGY